MMISTRIHGYIDFILGFFLILSFVLFSFPAGSATILPVVAGVAMIVVGLLTDFEMGVYRVLTIKENLRFDLVLGIIIILAPLSFGFAHEVFWPFVIAGIVIVCFSLLTKKESAASPENAFSWTAFLLQKGF